MILEENDSKKAMTWLCHVHMNSFTMSNNFVILKQVFIIRNLIRPKIINMASRGRVEEAQKHLNDAEKWYVSFD